MFSQRGTVNTYDGEYHLDFLHDDVKSEDGWSLSLDLTVTFKNPSKEFSRILLKPREADAVEPTFILPDENGDYRARVTITGSDNTTEMGFTLTPWISSEELTYENRPTTHVKLLSPEKITLCKDVLEGDQVETTWNNISEVYEGDSPHFLFDFTTEARRVLDFESFAKIISLLSTMSPRYGAQLGRTRAQFFKNMIIGDSGGKYHKIRTYDELQQKLDIFESQKKLEPVDEEYALTLALRDLEQGERFEELYDILENLKIVEERPHLLYDSQLEFFIAKSKIEKKNLPMSAVSELATDESIEDYDDAVKEAKIGGDSVDENANLWRDLIRPSIEYSHNTLQFVLGRYLHWKTRSYTRQDDNLEIVPVLYKGASELSRAAGDRKYEQLSIYNHHLREGFARLSISHLEAAEKEFGTALAVAANDDGGWYEKRADLMVTPLQYKTVAEVSGGPIEYEHDMEETLSVDIEEIESEDLEKKLSLIGERIRLLRAVFEETDTPIQSAVNSLRAKQYRLLVNQRIRNHRYELALETIEELIKLHAKLEDDKSRERAIGLRHHVSAVRAETQANFKRAADEYESVAEQTRYAELHQQQQFHRIRSDTCRAKSALLDGDISRAKSLIDDITNSVKEVKYEAADLSLLIDILRDFESSERSPIGTTLNQLSDTEEESHRNLSISFDYKPAVTAIVSAQRLKTRGVPEDLLRKFIQIGIAESFTPDSSEDVVSNTGLSDISVDSIWRNHLPTYTHRSLERIEIKENSVTTGDYSDIASKLLSTFEKYLEIIVEYYGAEHTSDWKETITGNSEKDLTLGDLAQFFQTEDFAESSLDCREKVKSRLNNEVIDGMPLIKIRNELDHGHIDILSKNEYDDIKSVVVEILEETAPEAPIIIQPKTRNRFGSTTIYSCELAWSHPQKQISLETEADMETDDVYFVSPECKDKFGEWEIIEIRESNISSASERRIVEAVKKL